MALGELGENGIGLILAVFGENGFWENGIGEKRNLTKTEFDENGTLQFF